MYDHLFDLARAHQDELAQEAHIERKLTSIRGERLSIRDRFLFKTGDWMIALGHRLHHATRCASQNFSHSEV